LEDRLVPANWTVTSAADTGPGTLRAIVAAATTRSGDTIYFDPNLMRNATITLASPIATTKNLIITGLAQDSGQNLGITISGNNATNIFDFTGAQGETLNNLMLTRGSAPNTGGAAITTDAGMLNLNADTFTNNVAGGTGGAISFSNTAGSLTATNCTFSSDRSTARFGGAVGVVGGNVSLSGCTFTQCGAPLAGGAVFATSQTQGPGSFQATNCQFTTTGVAQGDGGAIDAEGYNVVLTGDAFSIDFFGNSKIAVW
jgi:hypothetical protein